MFNKNKRIVLILLGILLLTILSGCSDSKNQAKNGDLELENQKDVIQEKEKEEKIKLTDEEKELLSKPLEEMDYYDLTILDKLISNKEKYEEEDMQLITKDKIEVRDRLEVETKIKEEEEEKEREAAAKKAEEERLVREAKEEEERIAREKEEAEEKAKAERKANETLAQQNAIKSANSYLDYTAFSKSGLIKQLEYEGYSKSDATYAVEDITVDWKEQAVLAGKAYLDYSSFSRSGLIKQLEFEGYSKEQATYAVDEIGL